MELPPRCRRERARELACRSGSMTKTTERKSGSIQRRSAPSRVRWGARKKWEENGRGGRKDRRTEEGRMEGHGQRRPAHPTELVIHRAIRRWATRFFRGKRNHLSPFSPLPYIFLQDLGTQWTSQGFKLLNQADCSCVVDAKQELEHPERLFGAHCILNHR